MPHRIGAEPDFKESRLRATPAGAYVYAEEEHKFIEKNIRLISTISILGNLLLCLAIYPRIPLLLLSLLPTSLGILWTTGVASFYPGEVNLISLSFIAILAGLGDDQVVHFFNRVPQEWAKTGPDAEPGGLDTAMIRAFDTTGSSILLCILTAATATAALAFSSFKALAEFGFILTVGMVMMMLHTLFTVPALMRLWWRYSKPAAPETITFRFLPLLARTGVNFVGRYPRAVVGVSFAAFTLSLLALPGVKMNRKIEVTLGADNPAIAGQNRLSARFGIEGSPDVLLISGSQEEVLERAEELTSRPGGLSPPGHPQVGLFALQHCPLPGDAGTIIAAAGVHRPECYRRRPGEVHPRAWLSSGAIRAVHPSFARIGQGAGSLTVEKAGELLPAGLAR